MSVNHKKFVGRRRNEQKKKKKHETITIERERQRVLYRVGQTFAPTAADNLDRQSLL